MNYKYIVLDLDGTLTNSEKEITAHTHRTILKAQHLGVRIILASGRPTFGITPLAKALELHHYNGYVLAFNGGKIINCQTQEVMYEKVLDASYIPYLYKQAVKNGVTIISYDDESIITEDPTDIYVQKEAFLNKMPVRQVDNFVEAINFAPSKCLIVGEPEKLVKLEKELKRHLDGALEVYRSEPYFLEIVPLHIDKAKSLSLLFEKIGTTKEEVIAIGDGFNDLSMIQLAGKGVAMANAQESVKACADYVTLSNEEDGVAHAIEKFIFAETQLSKITVEQINERSKFALMGNLGIQFTFATPTYVEATMPVDERTRQPFGVLHGGATLALGETVAGLGSMLACSPEEMVVGMQVSGNHVASAHEGDTVRAVGTIIHKGKSSHVWNVDVFTSTDKLVSSIRVINSVLRKR